MIKYKYKIINCKKKIYCDKKCGYRVNTGLGKYNTLYKQCPNYCCNFLDSNLGSSACCDNQENGYLYKK